MVGSQGKEQGLEAPRKSTAQEGPWMPGQVAEPMMVTQGDCCPSAQEGHLCPEPSGGLGGGVTLLLSLHRLSGCGH
jgi:hypothetical protein